MRLALFLAVLSMTLCGCVATRLTDPNGITLTRVSVGSEVVVKASRGKDGDMKVEESQAGGQDAVQALLDLLARARP